MESALITNKEEISIPSSKEKMNLVENFVDNIFDKYKINNECYGKIIVALTEAINNAIIHGNKQDINKTVDIKCLISDNELTFYIKNHGEGFKYSNMIDSTNPSPNNIGKGIYLMKYLSDKLEYLDKGSKVSLTFKI